MDEEVQSRRQPGGCVERLRLFRFVAHARDAEEVRRQPDARESHAPGGQPSEAEAAAAAARYHRQYQCDGLLSDPGRATFALQGRDLGTVRRCHARRELLSRSPEAAERNEGKAAEWR